MNKLTVTQQVEEKLRKGILLLDKKDFSALSLQNQCVELQNRQGKFLGTAYLSPQNKGVGWLISQKKVELNLDFFQTLFEQAKSRRSTYFHSADTTAFRLFNQEGDGFGGFTGLDYESAHLYGAEAPETFTVLENGVRYQVFLNDGLMTGIFLDQHDVRASLVDGLAAGKSLLNMFSYTAAFSVAAAIGGASQTVSVDLAKRSRELSEAHFLANGLTLDQHRFQVMDVFDYFKYAKRHDLSFDVIVIDPPSFARNKKRTFSVAKDYHRLVAQALEILNPQGIMILSTNAANLSKSKFKQEIEKGLAGRKHRYLAEYGLPADFVYNKKDGSSNYLKVFTIKVDQ